MIWRVLIPLTVVLLLGLIALFWAIAYRKRHKDILAEEIHEKKVKWVDEPCQIRNLTTGAMCERPDFHVEGHYIYVNGRFITW